MLSSRTTSRSGEHITGDLEFFTVFTLIDLTDSGVTDITLNDTKEYNQAQNLNTFLQSISLRTQPIIVSVSKREAEDLSDYEFGSNYTGSHNLWVVRFASEYKGAWQKDLDPMYYLIQDCNENVITTGLDDTIEFINDLFDTKSVENKNMYFIKYEEL